MEETESRIYSFREFTIDALKGRLINAEDEIIPLTPKVFDLLLYLVRNSGRPLGKDEIMSAVWLDTVVEESNLSQNISILRRALGEKRGECEFIATIPGHGYKFVANVKQAAHILSKPPSPDLNSAGSEIPNFTLQTGSKVQIENQPDIGNLIHTNQNPRNEDRRTNRFWPVAGLSVLVIVLSLTGLYLWRAESSAILSKSSAKTIAVLPFRPLVAESRDEALEIGMADTLIARLSGNREIVVRPLSSVRRYGNIDQDSRDAGRALGVESVLDGSIQRWGDKIRVNVRLINVSDGASLWNGTFDEKFTDIFDVQDAIAMKVVEALRLRLGGGDSEVKRQTTNIEAYRYYLQGRYYALKTTPAEIRKGIDFYQQAIDADPLYALAYAGMADAYRTLPITSDVASKEAFPKAKAAAMKAIEIDDRLPEAHIVLGYVASWYEWDWKTAEAEFAEAVENSPNNSDARRAYSLLLTILGKHDAAIDEMRMARELDPLSLPTNALEGQALHYAGRDAEARERLNKTFEIDQNFWIARLMLARIFIGEGKFDEALVELKRANEYSGGNSETISLTAYALAKTGRREEALSMLEELKSRSGEQYAPSYNIAMIYNGIGETGFALAWLEEAVDDRDVRLILLKIEPKWDNLRNEPRFIELMRRMNFSE